MRTAFLDANVLWSASTNPQSDLARKLDGFQGQLLTSNHCVREAERNLEDAKSLEELRRRLERMKIVPDAFGSPPGVKLPGKDIPVLASAALAGADFLVTGDQKHLGRLYGKSLAGRKSFDRANYSGTGLMKKTRATIAASRWVRVCNVGFLTRQRSIHALYFSHEP